MNNWYKKASSLIKTSSVTVMPADSYKVYQPMTLADLHNKLYYFSINSIMENLYKRLGEEKIELVRGANAELSPYMMMNLDDYYAPSDPEQSPFRAYTGKIRISSYEPANPKDIAEGIEKWIEHMKLIDDFEINFQQLKDAKKVINDKYLQDKGIDPSTRTTWEINVIKNPSVNVRTIPELNVSNGNWRALMKVLFPDKNIEEEDIYSGKISVDELEKRVEAAKSNSAINEQLRPASDSYNLQIPEDADPEERKRIIREQAENRSRGRVYDFGLSRQQVMGYLIELNRIIIYCKQSGVKEVDWS